MKIFLVEQTVEMLFGYYLTRAVVVAKNEAKAVAMVKEEATISGLWVGDNMNATVLGEAAPGVKPQVLLVEPGMDLP